MHIKTAHNNEMGVNTKVLRRNGNCDVVLNARHRFDSAENLFFSLRDLFIFLLANRKFFVYSGWGRVGVIENFLFIWNGEEWGNRINKKFFVSPPGISVLDRFVIIKNCRQ